MSIMKNIFAIFIVVMLFNACFDETKEVSSVNPINWEKRNADHLLHDSLVQGQSYLSVYSQIYGETEKRTYDLTATISMRNTSHSDTVYINKAEYFDTKGHSKRVYIQKAIYIAPMETVEIVIDEKDQVGGTGANFIFDWSKEKHSHSPLFEGIMISAVSRGLSFTTQGVDLE